LPVQFTLGSRGTTALPAKSPEAAHNLGALSVGTLRLPTRPQRALNRYDPYPVLSSRSDECFIVTV
ncbi:hypothetical protein, partial [Pollutimonas bauzanensis]|uniref:hypothetical protein n=1 Tax=Pollutimonas bauzanensis TaxID=658167 RepID=UPI00333E3029